MESGGQEGDLANTVLQCKAVRGTTPLCEHVYHDHLSLSLRTDRGYADLLVLQAWS